MPNFAERVEMAVDALSQNPIGDIDENEFIDASRLVYDGVRDIRQAVLMNRVNLYADLFEHRPEKTVFGVSDQVRHKPA